MQYFFLNRRFIRDRALQHALNEAYRGILISGRFPLAFLQVELSPDMFDVNVHPTKMEVRFLDSNRVYSGFLSAIREKFLASDLRSKFHIPAHAGAHSTENEPRESLDPAAMDKKRQAVADWISKIPKADGIDNSYRQSNRDEFSQLAMHRLPEREEMRGEGREARGEERGTRGEVNNVSPNERGFNNIPSPPGGRVRVGAELVNASSPHPSLPPRGEGTQNNPPPEGEGTLYSPPSEGQVRSPVADRTTLSPQGHLVVQMLHRYLVMETDEGIAFVDQHALHERILYEQLKDRMNSGQLESQRLLVPVPMDLLPNEYACVHENEEFFKTLGLTVEPFGGNTVLISAFPVVLSKTLPEEILYSLIEPVLESGKKLEQSELLDELLHSMACKAAVKAGDKLSSASMQHLIHLAELEVNSHHCPHGRPSTLIFTQEQIDKMFDRT